MNQGILWAVSVTIAVANTSLKPAKELTIWVKKTIRIMQTIPILTVIRMITTILILPAKRMVKVIRMAPAIPTTTGKTRISRR